jgi:hypothetical protein
MFRVLHRGVTLPHHDVFSWGGSRANIHKAWVSAFMHLAATPCSTCGRSEGLYPASRVEGRKVYTLLHVWKIGRSTTCFTCGRSEGLHPASREEGRKVLLYLYNYDRIFYLTTLPQLQTMRNGIVVRDLRWGLVCRTISTAVCYVFDNCGPLHEWSERKRTPSIPLNPTRARTRRDIGTIAEHGLLRCFYGGIHEICVVQRLKLPSSRGYWIASHRGGPG